MEPHGVSTDEVVVGEVVTDATNDSTAAKGNKPSSETPSVEIRGQTISYTTSSTGATSQQEGSQVPYHNSIEYWRDRQKPVKEKNLKLYKIISIFAIIAFFPLGIPAYWQAMKLKEDFYKGLEKGDLAECNKRALLLHKLLILAFTMCLFTAILVLAIVGGVQGDGTSTAYNSGSLHL